jgi:putative flippase GtrA
MSARTRPSPAGGRPDGLLRSARLRPLRFTLTGATAGIVQLLLLRCLEAAGASPLVSNGLGFLVAAQVNFVLSQAFTWADRPPDGAAHETLPRR